MISRMCGTTAQRPSEPGRKSIGYVITSLTAGGAERQMVELIRHLDREKFQARVLTYRRDDHFLPALEQLRIPVMTVERRSKLDLRPVLVLADWLRTGQVDLVHSYLRTSNLYAVLARSLARRGKVVATERSSPTYGKGLSTLHLPRVLKNADLTIANSQAARNELINRIGISPDKVVFVPNGLDMQEFSPVDVGVQRELRSRLGWSVTGRIALLVAAFDECKNHLGLLNAVAGLNASEVGLSVYLAGDGTATLAAVNQGIARRGLSGIVHVLGRRRDVNDLYRACDFVILNSGAEGTPNAVLEALACGKPVIATDVSDVSRYVRSGETGWLVPVGDGTALLEAIRDACLSSRDVLEGLGSTGRRLLQELEMDSDRLARRHEQVYLSLLRDDRAAERQEAN